jgi:hypothetical protein
MEAEKINLAELGRLRADFSTEGSLFNQFVKPEYFPELEAPRPCILEGGRGTGKTTVLRGLEVDGQSARLGKKQDDLSEWRYFGFYQRVNTNRVTAFQGPELDEEKWIRLFAHYINILLCRQLAEFVQWFEEKFEPLQITKKEWQRIGLTFGIQALESKEHAFQALDDLALAFEASLSNLSNESLPPLSTQGQPIDEFARIITSKSQMRGKSLFFLLDEFENLLDNQQIVINTLLKHAEFYSFKIGVRKLGRRRRTTLNPEEKLTHPADYKLIDIESDMGDTFETFASEVCRERLVRAGVVSEDDDREISELYERLSPSEEAQRLGLEKSLDSLTKKLKLPETVAEKASSIEPLKRYLILKWAEAKNLRVEDVLDDYHADPRVWSTRFANYSYHLMFSIGSGKGSGRTKYYSGWKTMLQLAGGNIRYLLQLQHECVRIQLRLNPESILPLSIDSQTRAAEEVGRLNFYELEGLSVDGAQLTRLVLAFGRIFQVFTKDAFGRAPEVNQFSINPASLSDDEVKRLLDTAVMHLALLRADGTKALNPGDTRSFDYLLHPVFAAFFGFSTRRKRKIEIDGEELVGLVREPKIWIERVLAKHNADVDTELPGQLKLFGDYYA